MPVSELVLSQVHLTGESGCPLFTANRFKPNFCTNCSQLLTSHREEAIPDDKTILEAIEYSQHGEKVPSCILPKGEGGGALYHGGYKAVMNTSFLSEYDIKYVVNTARGLEEVLGPKYKEAVKKAKSMGIVYLQMEWIDDTSYNIELADLVKCVEFIHHGITSGGSVLVHCAQGKSRSATAVIAYVMAVKGLGALESQAIVKEQRKMAEPNENFLKILKTFQSSPELADLRRRLTSE